MSLPKDPKKYKLWIEKISGKNSCHYGASRTKKTREKISKSKTGKKCAPFTEKHKQNLSKASIGKRTGKNNGNWIDGRTPLYHRLRHCFKYRLWRDDIYTRDDFTCQYCNKRGGYLHAHHIKWFSVILRENNIETLEQALECSELWNINNGITLCKKCHKKKHKKKKDLFE